MEKENSNFEQFSMYVLIQKTAKQKILIRMKARIPRIYKALYLCRVTGYQLLTERSQGEKFLLAYAG